MLVKPRTPTPFRPLQKGAQQRINEERAKKDSAASHVSMSAIGNERYGSRRSA